jgi:predicted esterase
MLAAAGASAEHRTIAAGHGLSQTDVDLAKAWLAKL